MIVKIKESEAKAFLHVLELGNYKVLSMRKVEEVIEFEVWVATKEEAFYLARMLETKLQFQEVVKSN